MNPIVLGKFIANLRNEKNLTQEELAEKLFIDKRKISRWECGTSVPEFEMLIKLSEILDVSLYELSICQRIPKEKLNTKLINKFKSIKDLKKYKTKQVIKIVLLIILFLFFIMTTIYTFKYNGTAEIYEFESIDDEYIIDGNYINTNSYNAINIISIRNTSNKSSIIHESDNCNFEIYNTDFRFIYSKNTNLNLVGHTANYDKNGS